MADPKPAQNIHEEMAALAPDCRDLPIPVIVAGLARWVADVEYLFSRDERQRIIEIGAAICAKATPEDRD